MRIHFRSRVMSRLIAVLCSALVLAFAPVRGADDKDAKDTKDAKALQGTWAYESMEWNGKKIPAEQIKATNLVIEGDRYAVKIGDKVTQAGTVKFDTVKALRTFDVTVTEGQGKGNVLLGIYKFDGDTATLCMNLTGRERPSEFKTAESSETVLVVAKRVKK